MASQDSEPERNPDLRPHLAALEAAADFGFERPEEAMESARRVARAVKSISRARGASPLGARARGVAEAGASEIAERLRG